MKTLIICAVGALAVAACQRPATETAEAPAATDAAVDTMAVEATGAAPAPAPRTSSSRATGNDPPGAAPPEPAAGAVTAGPSRAVRDTAKEKAEETNLHPRG